MVTPCLTVTPGNTVTSYAMGKIFNTPLKLMILSHLQFLAVLVDALLTTLFVHIVMHNELVINASACFSQ